MPNRRRRKLSTAMSAVAALAVTGPFAISAITDMTTPQPQEREFRQAAMVTDLPGQLMSALSQGLSQFGINLPAGLLGATDPTASALATPGLTPGLGTTGLTSPGLTAPGALGTTPGLTTPGLTGTAPAGLPPLTDPALSNTALLDPATAGLGAANPALTSPNPALTSPLGASPGGLTTPAVGGLDPALATTPISNGVGLPAPGEVPISAPIGLDSGAGTYPLLGDPSLGGLGTAMPATGGGGLLSELSSAANQLGAGQAIDLLKGVVMPMITSAMKPAAAAVPEVPVPAPEPVPGA